jgi:hypothetical protein
MESTTALYRNMVMRAWHHYFVVDSSCFCDEEPLRKLFVYISSVRGLGLNYIDLDRL